MTTPPPAAIVDYDVEDGLATVTLDSPANRNALSAQLVRELGAALVLASRDNRVRAILLTHTGSTFCAGNDLREASAEGGPQRSTARLVTLFRTMLELPKPVIARVDGHARAGGIGLVGACDIAIGGPGATFAFTEARLGLAPAILSLTVLTRMPERAAGRYLLTGEVMDAGAAVQAGLLTEHHGSGAELDAAVAGIVTALRACSPQGLTESKALATAALRAGFEDRAAELQQLSARMFASDEGREGMQAFFERRPPRWADPAG
jgi:enoyl-CoA hydratase